MLEVREGLESGEQSTCRVIVTGTQVQVSYPGTRTSHVLDHCIVQGRFTPRVASQSELLQLAAAIEDVDQIRLGHWCVIVGTVHLMHFQALQRAYAADAGEIIVKGSIVYVRRLDELDDQLDQIAHLGKENNVRVDHTLNVQFPHKTPTSAYDGSQQNVGPPNRFTPTHPANFEHLDGRTQTRQSRPFLDTIATDVQVRELPEAGNNELQLSIVEITVLQCQLGDLLAVGLRQQRPSLEGDVHVFRPRHATTAWQKGKRK